MRRLFNDWKSVPLPSLNRTWLRNSIIGKLALVRNKEHRLAMNRERLKGLRLRLDSLSPSSTLERGYAIVQRSDDGEVVRSIRQIRTGDRIDVRVHDGKFRADVDREPERISYV